MLVVLRLSHRPSRDERISTHCGLVARALGADKIIYSGEYDKNLIESVNDVAKRFGGRFSASYEKNWRKAIANFKGIKIHLTVYGLPVEKKIREIKKKKKNLMIIIGSEKVPGEVYKMADYNLSVTNQPHSEVAALSVFLHEYYKGKEKKFPKAKIKIIPAERGKNVKEKK